MTRPGELNRHFANTLPMGKITFRADDDLIDGIEEFDDSKSEVMRRALREYLEAESVTTAASSRSGNSNSLDAILADRVDTLVAEAVDEHLSQQDVNINITLDGEAGGVRTDASEARKTLDPTGDDSDRTCSQCGTSVADAHVYCPNCGDKVTHRSFCDCGDELRPDWAFCPSCGRRTPAADVLDSSDTE